MWQPLAAAGLAGPTAAGAARKFEQALPARADQQVFAPSLCSENEDRLLSRATAGAGTKRKMGLAAEASDEEEPFFDVRGRPPAATKYPELQ